MPMYRMVATGNALPQLGLSNLSSPFWTESDARAAMVNALQRIRDNAKHGVGSDDPEMPRLPQHERVNLVDEIEDYLSEGGDFYSDRPDAYTHDFRSTEAAVWVKVEPVASGA